MGFKIYDFCQITKEHCVFYVHLRILAKDNDVTNEISPVCLTVCLQIKTKRHPTDKVVDMFLTGERLT